MTVTMIVGSIFPQGYEADTYIKSWGEAKYQVLAKCGFLNLFHTKYFLILGAVLFLNFVFCSVVRWSARGRAGLVGDRIPEHAKAVEIAVAAGAPGGGGAALGPAAGSRSAAAAKAKQVLGVRGYKVLGEGVLAGGTEVVTARRGPWPEGVSLLYHIAMGVAIAGCVLSALYSFDGDVTLSPNEPVTVRTVRGETGAYQLANRVAEWSIGAWHPFGFAKPDTSRWSERTVTVSLNEFITEWEHGEYRLREEVPEGNGGTKVATFFPSRFKAGWELDERKYHPKDWTSDLTVTDDSGHTRRVLVEVNKPLRVSGLTFYQMAYEQDFDVVVSQAGEEFERVPASRYAPFTLESIPGTFHAKTLRVGTLYGKYTAPEPMVPHIPLKWEPPEEEPVDEAEGEEPGEPADTPAAAHGAHAAGPIEIGDLSAGEPLEFEGFTLMLENPREASVLSYRHDPGVALLYVAVAAFLLGMAIRTYWPSYRVNLWMDEGPAGPRGRMVFRATGMLGEPEDIERELVAALEEPEG